MVGWKRFFVQRTKIAGHFMLRCIYTAAGTNTDCSTEGPLIMMQNIEDIQKQAKDSMEMATENLSNVSKSIQAIATETAEYAKKSYEDGTQAAEKVFGAKSFDKFMEAQSEYAKNAYEAHISEMNKLGEMYMDLSKTMYSPVETAFARISK
jgi:hypothetical protein